MASAEGPTRAHDRHGRRRPFSSWMKRLANLKNSNGDGETQDLPTKRSSYSTGSKSKKGTNSKNNPYPSSASRPAPKPESHLSYSGSQLTSPSASRESLHTTSDEQHAAAGKPGSRPPTLSTTGETAISDATGSKAGTSGTAARMDGGGNSTFSSPAPSVRSMATTLTTVQSLAPSGQGNTIPAANGNATVAPSSIQAPHQFSHPFPPTSPPTTVPQPHLAPHHQPTTYTSATANNAWTDNASILTLASSSKRRRRNSADTNASMRALAPASVFGGSRESLPLSVLSGIIDPSAASVNNAPGVLPRPSLGGLASAERASLYSSSSVAPALPADRNSYYAGKQAAGDGASVISGLVTHGRNDSITNSIGGGAGAGAGGGAAGVGGGPTSPLAGPAASASSHSAAPIPPTTGKLSRRGSGWAEAAGVEGGDAHEKPEP